MKKLTLATIITGVMASSAIAAQQEVEVSESASTPTDKTFAALDTNKDGFVSQGEANQDNVWTYFVKVDEDEDGQLSPREFNTYASIYSEADLPLADAGDTLEQTAGANSAEAMAGAKSTIDNAEGERATDGLSQAKQDAISANAQTSNAKVDTQLTQHDAHDDVNTSDVNTSKDSEMAMKDAGSNAQNALDNAKELSVEGQDTVDHNANAIHKELEDQSSEGTEQASKNEQTLAESADVTISSDLESNNPALKDPEQPAPIEQTFAEVDSDNNGFISKGEAKDAEISEHFDNADVDSDDKISRQEYKTFVEGQQLTMRYSVRYPHESE